MLRSLARLTVDLDLDTLANTVIEGLYRGGSAHGRLSSRFQVLVYHKVSPDRHPFYEPVDPDSFDAQMRFLSRCYNVMDLSELVERSETGAVPPKAVAITFDDGYRDNYDYAFPILKKYGLTATVFVATGVTGSANLLWHDRVFDAFRFATVDRTTVLCPEELQLTLDSPGSKQASLDSALAKAKALWGESRSRFVDQIETALQPRTAAQPARMLNWDQIREMHQAGIAFGSHTVTHPILSRLPHKELVKELTESKSHLSEHLRSPILAFAYPNGKISDYNEQTKAVLKECGYRGAVTTVRGFNRPFSDPFELKRDLPWDREIQLFRLKFFLQRHGLHN